MTSCEPAASGRPLTSMCSLWPCRLSGGEAFRPSLLLSTTVVGEAEVRSEAETEEGDDADDASSDVDAASADTTWCVTVDICFSWGLSATSVSVAHS